MTPDLTLKFAISTAMLMLCVVIHGAGLFGLDAALRQEANAERIKRITPLSLRGALFTFTVVLTLIAVHGLEVWAYAMLYTNVH